jgi:hypothetical protein
MSTLRFIIIFMAAPFLISFIELKRWGLSPPMLGGALFGLHFSVALIAMVIVAYPTCFLVQGKWTAFWIAPVAGFVVAALIWSLVELAVIGIIGRLLTEDAGRVYWLCSILWPYGPLGALVASLLWLMVWLERRRDRDASCRSTLN